MFTVTAKRAATAVALYAARYESGNSRVEPTPARIPGKPKSHSTSFGNGCSSLLGTTAGQPHGNNFSSPTLGVTASTEQNRGLRLPSYVEYVRTHQYKKSRTSQSPGLLSGLSITLHIQTLPRQRGSEASNVYFSLTAVYHDLPQTFRLTSARPRQKSCSLHSPPPWSPSPPKVSS